MWFVLLALLTAAGIQQSGMYSSNNEADELTRWLLSFADESHTEQAYEKLALIDRTVANEQDIIAQASGIMLAFPDLFRLPGESDQEDDLAKVLFLQWSAESPSSGMNSSAQIERNRNAQATHQENPSRYAFAAARSVAARATAILKDAIPAPAELIERLLRPLRDGIAINAP